MADIHVIDPVPIEQPYSIWLKEITFMYFSFVVYVFEFICCFTSVGNKSILILRRLLLLLLLLQLLLQLLLLLLHESPKNSSCTPQLIKAKQNRVLFRVYTVFEFTYRPHQPVILILAHDTSPDSLHYVTRAGVSINWAVRWLTTRSPEVLKPREIVELCWSLTGASAAVLPRRLSKFTTIG